MYVNTCMCTYVCIGMYPSVDVVICVQICHLLKGLMFLYEPDSPV